MGDWWYLIFSEFSEKLITRYRMSRSLEGPWLTPMVDTFDDSYFYAAKTASDGKARYLFGWNTTREGEKDFNPGQWGGNLAVHELVQQPDGTLDVRLPENIRKHFNKPVETTFTTGTGYTIISPEGVRVEAEGTFAYAAAGELPDPCMVEANISFNAATRDFGLLLRLAEDGDHAYYVRLQPNEQQVCFDAWLWDMGRPRIVELRRPVRLIPGENVLGRVLLSGSVCEIYVNEQTALSTRLYQLPKGKWGVYAQEGSASFKNLKVYRP